MDLQDQLKNLFPDHKASNSSEEKEEFQEIHLQKEPISCKYEKRKGKPITILEGFTGKPQELKKLAKDLKKKLSVGGSFKDGKIIIQGNYRDQIMKILQGMGFKTKRVGG